MKANNGHWVTALLESPTAQKALKSEMLIIITTSSPTQTYKYIKHYTESDLAERTLASFSLNMQRELTLELVHLPFSAV